MNYRKGVHVLNDLLELLDKISGIEKACLNY
jgi:hypothetical protein